MAEILDTCQSSATLAPVEAEISSFESFQNASEPCIVFRPVATIHQDVIYIDNNTRQTRKEISYNTLKYLGSTGYAKWQSFETIETTVCGKRGKRSGLVVKQELVKTRLCVQNRKNLCSCKLSSNLSLISSMVGNERRSLTIDLFNCR
eukprot:scpid38302/ scgid14339/ 